MSQKVLFGLKRSCNDFVGCWVPVLLVSALCYVSLMSPFYRILILLTLALFPLVSTPVSDLVTRALGLKERTWRAPALSSNGAMLMSPCPLPFHHPSPVLADSYCLPHNDIHPLLAQHQPHPCPWLPRAAFEGQRSQNSLCSQHPHPP